MKEPSSAAERVRSALFALCTALLAALGADVAFAAPFPPDPAFGDGGSALLAGPGAMRNMAVLPSGGLLALAQQKDQLVLSALHPDGAADPSFGDGGTAALPGSGPSQTLGERAGLVVQDDGRIVVSGSSDAGTPYVARLLRDGTLDESFGEGGVAVPSLDTELCASPGCDAVAAAVDARGRIVLALLVRVGGQDRMAALRLTPDGTTDPSFGGGGVALLGPAAPGKSDVPFGLAIGSDGRIVVAGNRHVRTYFDTEILVFALTPDGARDPAFAGGEAAHVVLGGFINGVDVALRPNGRIVVGGSGERPDALRDMIAVRLLPSGALDRSFGNGGVAFAGVVRRLVPSRLSVRSAASAAFVAPDGKIVLAGVAGSPSGTGPCPETPYVALAVLTSAGRATSQIAFAAWPGNPRALARTSARALLVGSNEPRSCQAGADVRMRVTQLRPPSAPTTDSTRPIHASGGRTLPRR